jgi:hypothetical protein
MAERARRSWAMFLVAAAAFAVWLASLAWLAWRR